MKLKYILLALIPLCMAGCSDEESIVPVGLQREVRVTAGADAQSRIVLSDEGDHIRSLWQTGDQISLFTSTQSNLVYSTDIAENRSSAVFSPVDEALEDVDGNTVYACYPNVTQTEEDSMVVNLPSTEVMDYNDGSIRSFGYAVDTISNGSVNFKFKHISAFLGLTITPDSLSDATKVISSVTVTTTATEPLSVGEGDTFDFSTETASTTNGSNTVQINVDNLVVDSLWTVYIPLLPQPAGAEITVTMADSEGTTLYTVTKPTPESGFLAGRVYKQGISVSYDVAYLIDGSTFNERIKDLATGGESINYDYYDNIIKIEFVAGIQTLPEDYVEVSAEDSPVSIYASYNSTDSLLTISTLAKAIEVVDASYMFNELWGLKEIDFGDFIVNETTTNLVNMFRECSSLTTLDMSNWNTVKVTDMSGMFDDCFDLTMVDLSSWNTINVTNMECMFGGCLSLTSLDLSAWDISRVTDIGQMFANCSNLTTLNLSTWNISSVTSTSEMFSGCSNLHELNITNWSFGDNVSMNYMFADCASTSESCEITATEAAKEVLLNNVETTGMNTDYFTWKTPE